jgi:hypothetical protein
MIAMEQFRVVEGDRWLPARDSDTGRVFVRYMRYRKSDSAILLMKVAKDDEFTIHYNKPHKWLDWAERE